MSTGGSAMPQESLPAVVHVANEGQVPSPRGHAYAVSTGVSPYMPNHWLKRRFIGLRAVSFFIVFLIPFVCCAIYFSLIASDQYVSELRFGLRSAEPSRADLGGLSLITGLASSNQQGLDSYAVVQYLTSPQLVEEIDKKLAIREQFSDSKIDFLSRLEPNANTERLVDYWKTKIDANYDSLNGTVLVRLRAFSPEASFELAKFVMAKSEELVNELSARARRDSVSFAEGEVGKAEARLAKAQLALRNLRDNQGILDPRKAAEAALLQISKIRDQLIKYNAELRTLRTYLSETSPSVVSLARQVASYEQELQALEASVTKGSTESNPLSKSLGDFENKEIERSFAERYLASALEGLQRARASADRQQTYLASFVKPTLPSSSVYPRRWSAIALSGIAAMLAWILLLLGVYSVRDHT